MEIANHVKVGGEIDVPENLTVAEISERAAQSEVLLSTRSVGNEEIKDYICSNQATVIPLLVVVETVVGGVPALSGSWRHGDRNWMCKRLAQQSCL